MIDKNQAVIDYLCQCTKIQNSPLYFNLINAEDDNIQIITTSQDTTYTKPFIDGSKPKKFTFNLVIFKSITDLEVIKSLSGNTSGYTNENVDDLADAQTLIDWIQEQDDLQNFPNFGESCIMQKIQSSTDEPRFDGINTSINPPLAMYSMSIVIDYVDTSKCIWNK